MSTMLDVQLHPDGAPGLSSPGFQPPKNIPPGYRTL